MPEQQPYVAPEDVLNEYQMRLALWFDTSCPVCHAAPDNPCTSAQGVHLGRVVRACKKQDEPVVLAPCTPESIAVESALKRLVTRHRRRTQGVDAVSHPTSAKSRPATSPAKDGSTEVSDV